MRQTFAIQGRLDGLNKYIEAAHSPWKRTALKQANEDRVREAASCLKAMRSPVEITITYYEGRTKGRERVRDLDNVIGGGNKFILDALVDMGVIQGDGPNDVARIVAKGYMATTYPRIVVELAEIGG